MKKDKQWQKPDLSEMKQRDTKKVIASSRKGHVRYRTGIGPVPPPSDPPIDEYFR
jgi:adenylylsulfate kinase-like enzyme